MVRSEQAPRPPRRTSSRFEKIHSMNKPQVRMTVSSNRHGLKRGFDPPHGLFIFTPDFRVSAFRCFPISGNDYRPMFIGVSCCRFLAVFGMEAFGVLFMGVRALRFVALSSSAGPSIGDRSGHRKAPPRSVSSEERSRTPRTSGHAAPAVADP